MWDLGQLIYRGPTVVNPDIAFEPFVVRPAVAAATGVDHGLFADRLADHVLEKNVYVGTVWSAIGAARFIEDYLDSAAVETSGYQRILDSGLEMLARTGEPGVNVAPQILTRRQRERLAGQRPA